MSPPSLTSKPKGTIRVFRLNRGDIDIESTERLSDCSVIVGVSKAGRAYFDFKLVGTEGTEPFEVTYTKNAILSQRAENAACSPKAWEMAIGRLLIGNEPDPEIERGMEPGELDGMEAVAAVEEGVALKITVRKRIEGITQRLGTLTLPSSPDSEISLFDWCSLSLSRADIDQGVKRTQRAEIHSQKTQIEMLHARMDALIAAKEEHEAVLLAKFAALLNEKKLKIRDQQRLLASAGVDAEKVEEVVRTRGADAPTRTTRGTAKAKRKALVVDSESEDGFKKMAVDRDDGDGDSVGAREQEDVAADDEGRTTEDEDEETADEDSDGEAIQAPAPAAAAKARAEETAAALAPARVAEREKTPPRRELPFAKKGAGKAAAAAAPAPAEDEETDSDDEL